MKMMKYQRNGLDSIPFLNKKDGGSGSGGGGGD